MNLRPPPGVPSLLNEQLKFFAPIAISVMVVAGTSDVFYTHTHNIERNFAANFCVATFLISRFFLPPCSRIAGGIGAVIPWIPIKAYRPCPNFLDRGGFYQRSGQGLDELAFGRKPDE